MSAVAQSMRELLERIGHRAPEPPRGQSIWDLSPEEVRQSVASFERLVAALAEAGPGAAGGGLDTGLHDRQAHQMSPRVDEAPAAAAARWEPGADRSGGMPFPDLTQKDGGASQRVVNGGKSAEHSHEGPMSRRYFGTDGVRGRANATLTADLALRVGMAAGLVFSRGEHRHRVVIGKDTRLSGYMLETALVAGFTSVGMDVFLLGPMPTPAVGMLTRSMRADLGVMISASHNPFDDNGIKLFGPDGYKLSDEVEREIESLVGQNLSKKLAKPAEIGRAKRLEGVHARYIEYAKGTLPRNQSFEGMRVVVDCAHGAAYRVAPEALWELGADVISIGVEPDGLNINRDVGSTATAALSAKVREVRADIGIALDGDADRVILIDEKGHVVDGDQLMAVVAESFKVDGRLSRNGIVATVMSNLGLERYLAGEGIELARTAVGDRYVLERMRQGGYNVGGEQSGHLILSDYSTTGDGLVAALQVLAVVARSGKPVSEVCHRFEPMPQILKNVRYGSGKPLENEAVKKAIAHGEQRLSNTGRLLIRPSGTEPVIRVMGEGEDRELVETVVDSVIDALQRVAA
jgi:phosphoglucosamine mutase